jgi:lysophospholipase L1-like esterase
MHQQDTKEMQVLCLGDSHTRGFWSASYCEPLESVSRQYKSLFRNFSLKVRSSGVDGHMTKNLLERVRNGEIENQFGTGRPHALVLLIGTNDVLTHLWAKYGNEDMLSIIKRANNIPEGYEFSEESFQKYYDDLLGECVGRMKKLQLQDAEFKSGSEVKADWQPSIFCLTLPPLGENISSDDQNREMSCYNEVVRNACKEGERDGVRLHLVDIDKTLRGEIRKTLGVSSSNNLEKLQFNPLRSKESLGKLMVLGMLKNKAGKMGKSFLNRYTPSRFSVMTDDGIHFTQRAAEIVALEVANTIVKIEKSPDSKL